MMPTETVTYTTPDGVERVLRFTLGARKRIGEIYGRSDLISILNQYGDGALPDIAYAMMYDEKGVAPAGLERVQFAEQLDDPDEATRLLAAIMSAISKGAAKKNELEPLLKEAKMLAVRQLIGLSDGVSPINTSDSPLPSSGGSPSENLKPSVISTETSFDSSNIAPV